MLLSHHAGLPSDLPEGLWGEKELGQFSDSLPKLARQYRAAPLHPVFADSNVGMTTLGLRLEQQRGTTLENHMADQILKPLGMTSSFFAPEPPSGLSAAATYDSRSKQPSEPKFRDTPAGGFNRSASNLATFLC